MLTDTHCHIFKDEYNNIETIINNLKNDNIKRIIINGYNLKTNKEVIKLCAKYENVFGALGLYPGNIDEQANECLDFIEANLNNPKILAIGEIGLDFYYTKENIDKQIEILKKQLDIAQKYNKPVIIHNRQATNELIKILKKYELKGIIHCFNGSFETAKEFLKLNYKLGINGIITFKNNNLGEVLKKLPLNSFVLETDSPYLTPEPLRGKQNQPKYINYTAQKLSEILNISIYELIDLLEKNYQEIFNK